MSDRVPAGYGEFHFHFQLVTDPEPMLCSLGVQIGVGFDTGTATALSALWQETWAPYITEDYNIGPDSFTLGSSDPGDPTFTLTGTTPGELASVPVPQNTAYLVQKRGLIGGRRARGRMFVPGVPNTHVTANGQLDTAVFIDVNAALDTFVGSLVGDPEVENMVILHQSEPFAPTVVTSLQLSPSVATQRRRLRP